MVERSQPHEEKFMVKSSICNAIKNCRQISIVYDGQVRIVDPYLIGITTAGNETLRAYQVRGYSERGGLPAWRIFTLKKISGVEILNTSFTIRPDYNPNDQAMVRFSCRVEKT